MFSVFLSQRSQKFLEKLDTHIRQGITKRLKKLGENPYPSDIKFIARDGDDKLFRFRVGEYRALFKVKEKEKIVRICLADF